MTDATIIPFPRGGNVRFEGNYACEKCGCEWWNVGVTLDKVSGRITGQHSLITCRECGYTKVHIR